MGEQVRDEHGVVGSETALQRGPERRQLRPQLALGEVRQRLGIRLALAERPQHRLTGGAERTARHRGQLDVGVLEHLLQAVGLAAPLPGQRLAIARQIAQLADRLRRHEARPQQPVLEQLAEPLGIQQVSLSAGHVLDVLGVHEQQLEVVLEQVVDRLPVDAGRLHRDVSDTEALEPIAQPEQVARHRRELGAQLRTGTCSVRHMDAGGHLLLVHIKRATALIDALHLSPPTDRQRPVARGEPSCSEILLGVRSATVRGAADSPALLLTDSWCQNVGGLNSDDRPSLTHFMRRG